MRIRPAQYADLTVLQDIERAAGRAFHDVGMPEIAEDEPFTVAELDRYRRAGRAWVATDPTDPADAPVAYLIADVVDGNLHIEQVTVHPDVARRGVGRRLIDHAARYAAVADLPALTLTTFRDVPWNAPYYARLGFHVLGQRELGPELREVRQREAAHGLDRWPRVCLRRDL